MKYIFTFLAGVITGVAGVFVWQVWGKPTKPAYDGWADEFLEPDDYLNELDEPKPKNRIDVKVNFDGDKITYYHSEPYAESEQPSKWIESEMALPSDDDSLSKTQPVKVK